MKRIYSSGNLMQATLLADWLRAAGIEAHVLNQNASSLAGEIPLPASLPQVWITNPAHAALSAEIIRRFEAPMDAPDWTCEACSEANPATFAVCWRCTGINSP
jgi:hypothetical protein